jgi:hypothetical protein
MPELLISIETLTNKLSTHCRRFSTIIIFIYNLCRLEFVYRIVQGLLIGRERVTYSCCCCWDDVEVVWEDVEGGGAAPMATVFTQQYYY